MPRTRRLCWLTSVALGLIAAAVGSRLHAQAVETIQVETHLIELTASVHDARGLAVTGLAQQDFTIAEDGIPQRIRFFAHETQLPLSIGILIDVSGSQDRFEKQHEKAIEEFLVQVLGPRDEAFAVCFGNHLRLVSDTTSSGATIVSGIRAFNGGDHSGPELGPKEDRDLGTALHDAVFYSVTEKLTQVQQRRKVLLVFSDGQENSSEHDLMDAIEAAQNADVLVYAIRTTETKHGKMNARDRYGMRVLDHLTGQTGGTSYDASSTNLKTDFDEIASDLRSLYEIAYQSTNPVRDGLYRKVVVRTTRADLTVRAHGGYYAR